MMVVVKYTASDIYRQTHPLTSAESAAGNTDAS